MANITTTNLISAATPVLGTDLMLISRDGTVLSKVSVTDGMNGLTPSINVAAPNTTVPVQAFVASNTGGQTYTNIDVAIVPKGTGAFSLQVADGAITGGNKRGANAVDLQTSRTAATQVASGSGAFLMSGVGSTASGQNSVAGGENAVASARDAIAIGRNTVASGIGAVALGNYNAGGNSGAQATAESAFAAVSGKATGSFSVAIGASASASGTGAFSIAGGLNLTNSASGTNSGAIGVYATTNGIQGQVAFGHNSDALGRYQTTLTGLRQVTTGTTATRATADGATAATANQLTLRNNSVFKFMGRVVAYDLTTLDAKEWEFSGLIKRGANAAATSLVGTPSVTSQFADTAAASWMVAVSADTTNGALAVTVTGAGANQIRWYVEVFAYETGV